MADTKKKKEDKYATLDDLTKVVKEKEVTTKDKKTGKSKKEKKITIENLNEQINIDKQDPKTFNQIIVHTEKDNLVHNYFHYFEMYWDAGDCMSSVMLRFPKTDKDNTKYWLNYTGEISIYMGDKNSVKTLKQASKKIKNSDETYWFIDGMTPVFKGEIGQIKEKNKEIEIRVDSIGKRFKQKIPDEFRQAYINNQNVRDAFQAICEFIGVKYICPPPTTTSTNETETDGTENDPNNQQGREQNARNQAQGSSEQNQSQNSLIAGAANSINKIYNQAKNNITNSTNNQNNDEGQQNNDTTNQNNTSASESTPINGYTDISFDANGVIVHGSTVIEESPDMVETLIAMEEHPLDKYLEDTKNVAKDVTALLKGHFFDTVHNNVFNYGSITIEAKNASTSTPSESGAEGSEEGGEQSGEEGGESGTEGSGSGSGNGSGNTSRTTTTKNSSSKKYIADGDARKAKNNNNKQKAQQQAQQYNGASKLTKMQLGKTWGWW